MKEEVELLRRYADEGSQPAFGDLVRRTVDLVYAAALRQTGGDAHLAEDVTQGVFLALARRAGMLKSHVGCAKTSGRECLNVGSLASAVHWPEEMGPSHENQRLAA